MLTGYKDTDIIILKFLSFHDLLSFSLVCKAFNLLSKKEELWEKLCIEDLGFIKGRPIYRSFRDFYLGVKYYDGKYSGCRILKEICKKEQYSDIAKYFYEKADLSGEYPEIKYLEINRGYIRSAVKYGNEEMFNLLYEVVGIAHMYSYARNSIGKCENENILKMFLNQSARYRECYIDYIEGGIGKDINFDLGKYEDSEGRYNLLHLDHALAFSVKLGDLDYVKKNIELCILKTPYEISKLTIYTSFFYKSCRKGQLEIAQYLLEQIKSEKGNFKKIDSEKGLGIEIELRKGLLEAARGGHIHIMEFLFSQGAKNVNGALESSARGGKINVVKYILKEKRELINNLDYALTMAVNGGYKEVIVLLEEEVQLKNQEVLKRREEAKARKREKKQKTKVN